MKKVFGAILGTSSENIKRRPRKKNMKKKSVRGLSLENYFEVILDELSWERKAEIRKDEQKNQSNRTYCFPT